MVSSKKEKESTTKENVLGNISFAIGYLSDYRYYKQLLLEQEYDTIEKAIPNLKLEQYENLKQMIEIEMIINGVQYCSELAAFAICIKNKKRDKLIQFLSSLAEADIRNFYETIRNADFNKLEGYMGYKEIKLDENEKWKYRDSCKRFKQDIEKLSLFYKQWYSLFTAYKHGLRLIPYFDEIHHQKVIMEACKDNTLTICGLPETWYLEAIDVTCIIRNIYKKLYTPFIKLKFYEYLDLSPENLPSQVTVSSPDVKNIEGNIKFKLTFKLPWLTPDEKAPEPFY